MTGSWSTQFSGFWAPNGAHAVGSVDSSSLRIHLNLDWTNPLVLLRPPYESEQSVKLLRLHNHRMITTYNESSL